MAALEQATQKAIETATRKAELAIQKILLGLEHDTLLCIESVQVDTRNFSNMRVEIFLER